MSGFFSDMLLSLQQVVILYVMVAVGFAADKLGFYTEKTARKTNDLIFYVVTPCVIVNAFITTPFSAETGKAFLTAALVSAGSHLCGILLSLPFFNKDKENGPIYKFSVVYANCGYMAIPLAQAVLGEEGVFYASAGVVVFNVLCFSHGIGLMSRGKSGGKRDFKKLLLNPGLIAVAIGLPIFLTGVRLPQMITEPVRYLSLLNTPMAMVILGTYIANTGFRDIFLSKERYLASGLRLIAVPLIMFGVMKLAGLSGAIFTACMISAAAPSATNTVMMTVKYDRDAGVASKQIAFCTMLCVLTMPVMIALSKAV